MKHNWTKVLLSFAVSTTLFSSCKPDPDTDSPPKDVYTPSVFIGSQNQFLYALEPATGRKKWESYIGADIKASPVLHKDIVFVGASNILFELNPNTGTIIKQSKYAFPGVITTTPVAYDSFMYTPAADQMTCLNFILDAPKWTFKAGGTINSSPTIIDTQLIFGCDDGYVYMLDHRNGKQIWKAGPFGTSFFSSPAVDTGTIYIGAEDGKLYALKRKDGSHAWLTGPKQTGAKIRSSPLVYGGTVFFGSDDQKLYAIQIIDGATVWTMNTADRVRSSPFLQGQTVYVGSYDQNFYAVNVLDGSIKWQYKTGGLIASSPVYYNNRIYFGSYDRNFYALEAEKGSLTWKYAINGLIDCSPTVDVNNGQGINSTISGNSTY